MPNAATAPFVLPDNRMFGCGFRPSFTYRQWTNLAIFKAIRGADDAAPAFHKLRPKRHPLGGDVLRAKNIHLLHVDLSLAATPQATVTRDV
jgi:hypothetical protein